MKRLATGVIFLALLVSSAAAEETEPSRWEFDGVDRVVAIGDVHGSYEKLIELLSGTGVIDTDLAWAGGANHLVFCGDMVDRGPDDRAVLDLIRRLEEEAEAAGGQVHHVLGNHEVMNLTHDMRYVDPAAFAAFTDLERKTDRTGGFTQYRSVNRGAPESAFDEEYPPGYFGRTRAFAPDGLYGSWLLTWPAVIKINGYLFVHGGLTERVAALGLDEINRQVQQGVKDALANADKHSPFDGPLPHDDTLPFDPDGPLWYRGDSLENERLLRARAKHVLDLLDARGVVVAHTPTGTGVITSRLDHRVFRTDVGMAYGGKPQALMFRGEAIYVFDPDLKALTRAVTEPPEGDEWSSIYSELPEQKLERFLQKAKIVDKAPVTARDGRVFQLLHLEQKGLRMRAVFNPIEEQPAKDDPAAAVRRYQHGVAAYRLDRLLGLGMVPVTVLRKINGKEGGIQIWLEEAMDLPFVQENGEWNRLRGLGPQIGRVRLFSALIDVHDRLDMAKMLLPNESKIMASDNAKSFSLSREVNLVPPKVGGIENAPADVREEVGRPMCSALGPAGVHRLQALKSEGLQETLGDYISGEQIDALLARRDKLLEACANSSQAGS